MLHKYTGSAKKCKDARTSAAFDAKSRSSGGSVGELVAAQLDLGSLVSVKEFANSVLDPESK